MASKIHKIRRQYLEVELSCSESEGLAFQRKLPIWCQAQLTPELERVFELYSPQDENVIIERLDINIGIASGGQFEENLLSQVSQAIGKFLSEHLPPLDNALPLNLSQNVQRKKFPESIHEAFVYFLNTGNLPWSFQLIDGKTLEQTLFDLWQDEEVFDKPGANYKATFIALLKQENALQRLVFQFSTQFMASLLAKLSPANKQAIDVILPMLHSSNISSSDIKTIEQQIWKTAFYSVAEGKTLTLTSANKHVMDSVLQVLHSSKMSSSNLKAIEKQLWEAAFTSAAEGEKLTDQSLVSKVAVTDELWPAWATFLQDHWPHVIKNVESRLKNNHPQSSEINKTQNIQYIEQETKLYTIKDSNRYAKSELEDLDLKEGLFINCAGLVLLHPFLPQFFNAIGIVAEDQLSKPNRALCLLHFLATGQMIAPEYELVLPKILCNIPLDRPVAADVSITDEEQQEAIALLEAVIRHWEVLKNTSIDGLRGTYLVRAGKLTKREDGDWLLQVESKSFDILMNQLPWGISMVKLPWMQRMLWVEWSY